MTEPQQLTPISLMDTTLRDGEQTPDVAFSADEKLCIAQELLCEVGVDRIEVCSARVSAGERESARRIAAWAASEGHAQRVEALGYCDGARSVDWLCGAGIARMNLLVKGSERHCRLQLGLRLEEHLASIRSTLESASSSGLTLAGVYLEDWSRGVAESPGYVTALVEALVGLGVRRLYLADTLGISDPLTLGRQVRRMCRRFPGVLFELHAHDDYGLATANCLAAVRGGASGLHTTVNGLGERAGNASLSEVVVALRDHAGRATAVDETRLLAISERVARASGHGLPHNAPIVGEHVFTQTAGIHADGDAKAGLYGSRLAPERFGRSRQYALGKLSGRASLTHHLRQLEIELSPAALDVLLEHVVREGDRKRAVRREDLPGLIRDGLLHRGEPGKKEPARGEGAQKPLMKSASVSYPDPSTRSLPEAKG